MAELTKEEKAQLKAERESAAEPQVVKGESRLAVNQQAAAIAQNSATASFGDGGALAMSEATGFVQGYVETSQKITEVVASEIEKARQGFSAAIRSASVPEKSQEDQEAFLEDFSAQLSSLTGL